MTLPFSLTFHRGGNCERQRKSMWRHLAVLFSVITFTYHNNFMQLNCQGFNWYIMAA